MDRQTNIRKHIPLKMIGLLLLLLALCLTGCGSKDDKNTDPKGQAAETTADMSVSAESDLDTEAAASPAETDKSGAADAAGTTDTAGTANTDASEASGAGSGSGGVTAEAETSQAETAKKEPPSGWELTLPKEDWGLFFEHPGSFEQPSGNASPEDLAWYDAYYMGNAEDKVLYLTFDCGYENGNTEPILAALKKHNVKGTFFVTGAFLESAPDVAKRIVEEGHTVGNHTYNHPDMAAIADIESFQKELDDVSDLFYEITGTELSPYYRPPQGKCNVENLKMAQELGYATVFWSLAHVDWDQENQPSHEKAFEVLTERTHPGAVVLLHAISQTNGEILDEMLTRWEEMGYTFETLKDLTGK